MGKLHKKYLLSVGLWYLLHPATVLLALDISTSQCLDNS